MTSSITVMLFTLCKKEAKRFPDYRGRIHTVRDRSDFSIFFDRKVRMKASRASGMQIQSRRFFSFFTVVNILLISLLGPRHCFIPALT